MEMMEKVAYLKGLADGLGLDDSTKEGKVLKVMIDLLDDVVLTVTDMDESLAVMGEELESVEEDLNDIYEDLYGDDDDVSPHDFEGELYEVTCPECADTICVDEDMLDEGEISCPGCGKMLEFDLSGVLEDKDIGEDGDN